MPVTTDFAGTETLAETKSRLGTLLTAYGYDSSGYSTWGDARTDLNSALTAIEETTISDGELASSFRSKLNALNAWSDYPAGGKVPNLVFDFEDEFYRADDTETTFGDSITFSRASSATYVDSDGVLQTAASGVPRIGHHVWNGSAWVNEGLLHESEQRVQLLHTTNALVTQSKTVTAVPHTLHFTGTGTVTLSGASTAGPLVGTGTGEQNRVSLTFTPSAGTLTLTVSGTVTDAQLEVGSTPSSYIPNLAGSGEVTRAAETLTIPAAKLPYSATAMSIQMDGRVTYADTDQTTEVRQLNWNAGSGNYISHYLQTNGARTGLLRAAQSYDGTFDSSASPGTYLAPGVLVPYNFSSRHGSTFVRAAEDGTLFSAGIDPTALPDLSTTDLNLGHDYMGTIRTFRMWDQDIGDSGIEEAST